MPGVGGATRHDRRGDPGGPGRGGGPPWGPTASDPQRQRAGVRGRGGEVVAGGDRLGCVVRGPGEPVAEWLRGVVPRQAARRVPEPGGFRERGPGPGGAPAL